MARYQLFKTMRSHGLDTKHEVKINEHDDLDVMIKRYKYYQQCARSRYEDFEAYIYDRQEKKKMRPKE